MEYILEDAKNRTVNRYFYVICASLLPFFFSLLWLLKNTQLPTSDANQYFTTSFSIYKSFTHDGLIKGLVRCFFERGWRPIFFPVLMVPFLLVSHGNIILSYKITTLILILASTTYIYLYLRLFLNKFSAIIATNLICLLPFLYNTAFFFMAETALFPLTIGTLYHLVRSKYFTQHNHNIGFAICLSLAMLIRPIEAITNLLPVFLLFFAIGIHKPIFTVKQLLILLAITITTILVFEFFIFSYYMHHNPFLPFNDTINDKIMTDFLFNLGMITVACMLISAGFVIYYNPIAKFLKINTSDGNTNPIVSIFSLITFTVLIWFAPFAYQTFSWIYATSIGSIAKISTQSHGTVSTMSLIFQYISEDSLIILSGTLIIAFTSLKTAYKRGILTSPAFLYLFLLLPFPVWEVLNTCQTESRKLSIAVSCALIALFIAGLQRGKYWLIRLSIIISLLSLQFIFALNAIYPNPHLEKYQTWFGNYSHPITISPNPHDIVLNFLDKEAAKYNLKHITIIENWKYYMPAYPYLLIMMADIYEHSYKLTYPFYNIYSQDIFNQLSRENDAIVLISFTDKINLDNKLAEENYRNFVNESLPDVKIYYGFQYYFSSNKLNEIGFKQGPCTTFKANDGYDYKCCLLISLKNTKLT